VARKREHELLEHGHIVTARGFMRFIFSSPAILEASANDRPFTRTSSQPIQPASLSPKNQCDLAAL